MTNAEKKYAIQRINEILHRKVNDLRDAYDEKANEDRDKTNLLKLLKAGKLKLRPNLTVVYGSSFVSHIFETRLDDDKAIQKRKKIYNHQKDHLRARADQIADQIMLGVGSAALGLIEAFDKE